MKFKGVFVLFIMFFVLIGGVSAEEVNPNMNVDVVEFNLQSLFGDFISQISSIVNDIVMLFFSENEPQMGSSSGWGIADDGGDDPKELEKRFNNGKNVENLTNINSMNGNEVENYVTKLASSKGYEIINSSSKINGFQVWYAVNDNKSFDVIQILIQNKTGKIVFYSLY
nr:hypothetical protein [Methanobrevibacter arboriphilus]